jgi:hypothetical protein
MRIVVTLLTAGSLLLQAQSGTVSGSLVVGANKVPLLAGSAVGYAGAAGRLVSVLLSDKPHDPKAFAEYSRIGAGERYVPAIFEGAWKALHLEKALSGITFTIDPKRQLLGSEVLVGGRNNAFSLSPDDLLLELKSVSPRLTGRLRTRQPALDVGTRTVGLDATFDVAVVEAGK